MSVAHCEKFTKFVVLNNQQTYYYKKKTGCDFCKYKSICMFNTNIKNNEYNIIRNTSKDVILEELENEYKC